MADEAENFTMEEAGGEEMTWNDYTVLQLKDELTVRGLETTGRKADLVARLEKYDNDMLAQQKQQEEDNGDEFVVWNVDEEQEDTQDEHEVEFLGTTNGVKADEAAETGGRKETEGESEEKPAAEDAEPKEPEPDFTTTPSKDGDVLLLTWCGKRVPIPFRDEIVKDLRICGKQQNIMMYPVQLDDIFSDTFRPFIEAAVNVSTELDEMVPGHAIKGYLRLKFGTMAEAARAVETLKEYKRDDSHELTIKCFAEDDSEGHVLSKIKKDEAERKGPLITRLLFVGNLPDGIAEEALKESFPDALRAIVPTREESTEKPSGYAYMEYGSEAEVTEAAKKYRDVEIDGHRLYVIKCMTERMMSFGLLKDSLRKYWLEQIRGMEATKAKSHGKTPREIADLETKLKRMKRRVKKDNERRELLAIPVPESEMIEVPETDEEKDAENKAKEERPKEDRKSSEHHSHHESRSADRRRSPPRRRPSPPRYRGNYRGGSRGGYRGGPPPYRGGGGGGGGGRDGNADRLVDQLQELVGALAHRERSDYGGSYGSRSGGYYDPLPPHSGRGGGYGSGPSYRGDYHSGSRFPPKRPVDSDYMPERKRHAGDDYYGGGRGGGGYGGSYGGPRRGSYY